MSFILKGVINESQNSVFLTETITYKLWESAGKKIVEAQLTADQIKQLFANIEQGATAAGSNRTMIGKGVDATSAVNKAWEDLKTKVQNSGPIKNVDAMYDQAAEKLKQATGGDQGVMKYVQKYRDFAKEHPIAQSLIYSALIAAAGITGAGLGGAAALGLFKLVDKLLQGEKFSSAAYSGAKTGALAYGASKIGDLIKGKPADVDPNMKYQPNVGQIKAGQGAGDVVDYGGQMVSGASDPNVARLANWAAKNFDLNKFDYVPKGGTVYIYDKTGELVGSLATDPGLRKAGIVTGKQALEVMKKAAGVYESIDLNEATIKLVFSRAALEYDKQLTEGIMDTLKGAAGKAAGAVKQFGTNLTTKVTADKLNSAWEKAGKPTESGEIATLLVKNGVPQDVMLDVFAKMKIPATSTPAPAAKPTTPTPTTTAAKPAAKPSAPATQPQQPAATAPTSSASAQPAVNPELQKRLAARKAGKPVYSGGLEEGADRQAELEIALQKAKQITKQIKYDDTATDIIVQIQMLAEKFNIDKDSLESAIDDVYNAKNQLESAVYGLDEVFEEALQQSRWDDDEILDENLRKWFKEKWVRFGPDGKIRGACARGDDSEGKPKCLPQSKAHSLGKKGRASAAARKRREDPNPERSGAAINVATKKKSNEDVMESEKRCMQCGMTNCSCPAGSCKCKPIKGWIPNKGFQKVQEDQLDEACWKGYHKEGNKKMFGKTYPNCVKNTNEEQLDEKCWDTHKQVGMKSKGGKMVPNCVPKESVAEEEKKQKTAKALIYQTEVYGAKGYYGQCKEPGCDHKTKTYDRAVQAQNAIKKHHQKHFNDIEESHQQCPECGGAMYEAEMMNEKKDACYYKVKSRYKVWPSAYASGALVKCRKKGASNWGTGGKKNEDTAYAGGMGQGGNAGQSYRKYKVKPSGIAQGISETEAVNRNDGDGWRWYNIKPAGK